MKGGSNMKLNKVAFLSTTALAFTALTNVVSANGYYYDYTTDAAADAAAASGFFGLSLIYICCVCLVPLIVGGVLAYVVYKDAKKNNVENPALWAILTFFFSLIGLLVYFLAIRPEAIKKNSGLSGVVNEVKEKVEEKLDDTKQS